MWWYFKSCSFWVTQYTVQPMWTWTWFSWEFLFEKIYSLVWPKNFYLIVVNSWKFLRTLENSCSVTVRKTCTVDLLNNQSELWVMKLAILQIFPWMFCFLVKCLGNVFPWFSKNDWSHSNLSQPHCSGVGDKFSLSYYSK